MITKWEIIPYPAEKYPDRYKVNIKCDYDDLKKIIGFYGKRCGLPWKLKNVEYDFSFYIYKVTTGDIDNFNSKIKEFQGDMTSSIPVQTGSDISKQQEKEKPSSFYPEPRAAIFPPRPAHKQPTREEIAAAKEITDIIDFDIFEPDKLEGIEISKETGVMQESPPEASGRGSDSSEQNAAAARSPAPVKKSAEPEENIIPVGIVFRSGQDDYAGTIEENLLKSITGKKLKYRVKIVFAKGYLVFSDEDISDAVNLCKEKGVGAVIVAGEVKLADVFSEALGPIGVYTEHIHTTDINKKSLYFNIVTNIILAETEKRQRIVE